MKKGTVFFLGVATGSILALVFVTAVLAVASWKFGFFNPRPAPAPVVSVRPTPPIIPGQPPGPAMPAPSATATVEPVLHLMSQNLNLLDGKFPITAGDAQVQRGDGYLVVSDAPKLRISDALTVALWFKPRYFNKPMTLGSRAISGPPWQAPFASWLLRINNDQLIEGSLAGAGFSPSTWLVPVLQPGQWSHAVLIYDGHTKMLFLNGARQTQLNSGMLNHDQGIANTPGRPIMIGADESFENPDAEKFDGAIDDVQLFNRALSGAEVSALYNGGARRYGVGR